MFVKARTAIEGLSGSGGAADETFCPLDWVLIAGVLESATETSSE
jgi:hypothetical protein